MRRPFQSPALVSAFHDTLRPDQRACGQAVQRAVLAAAPRLRVEVRWDNLVFSLDGVPLLALVVCKANVHLQVFNGVDLRAPCPPLLGAGRGVRHLLFPCRKPVDEALVTDLTRACLGNPAGGGRPQGLSERAGGDPPTMGHDAFEPDPCHFVER